ncbi:MFS transporter [Streptomyces sp. NPDC003077]|uniref:MFS transporter n=1 Tax=Streptomyces sp. NPDC003077 TaxID=3154443 RepID=UPI0033B5218B
MAETVSGERSEERPGAREAAVVAGVPAWRGGFGRLWGAAVVSRFGDALRGTALPLLAYALTDSPVLIALVTACGFVPWLLFGLVGGAIADRVDQRRAMWVVDVLRGLLMAAFAVALWLDEVGIGLLLALSFALTTFQTVFDNAATALLPSVVPQAALARANARLMTGQEVMGRFVGGPVVPLLIALGAAVPFAADAVTYLVAAVLVASLRVGGRPGGSEPAGSFEGPVAADDGAGRSGEGEAAAAGAGERRGSVRARWRETREGIRALRGEMGEGLRALWGDRVLRVFSVAVALGNVGIGALIATLVVLVKGWLGAGDAGYAAVTTGYGVGMVVGGLVAPRVVAVLGGPRRTLLIAGLVQCGVLVAFGTVRSAPVAVGLLGVFGFAGMVWNVVETTAVQRRSPARLLGRISAAFRTVSTAGAPLGALLGGAVAAAWGPNVPALLAAALIGGGSLALIPVLGAGRGHQEKAW